MKNLAGLRFAVLAAGVISVTAACSSGVHEVLNTASTSQASGQVALASLPPDSASKASASAAKSKAATTVTAATSAKAKCSAPANTPGGSDPWGGCWPGPGNTGPRGVVLQPYSGRVRSDGSCMITTNTVIIGKRMACQVIVNSGNLTLEDVSLVGEVYNYGHGSVLIKNSTINGGSDLTETVLGSHVTIIGSNLFGNQHEVYCGNYCTVENSWLHNNHNFGSAGHQNGFLSTGGSHYNLQHNSVGCVGGCTGDITFLGNSSIAVVNRNLLVAAPTAAFCLYPSSSGRPPGIVNQMTITNNVFQRGNNGKCAYYGPVYGWDKPNNNPGTSGYHNVWSGNIWSNRKVLKAP